MNVGVIGAGVIGNKRSLALSQVKGDNVTTVVDIDREKAKILATSVGCRYSTTPQTIFEDPKVDAVVVSTVNKYLAPFSLEALRAGKHVLCEKPLGTNAAEIEKCVHMAQKNRLIYKAGYNHRFHPAISEAHKLVTARKIGQLMFIKASYGHGARPGYDKEWRAQKELSGGGELLDQGCHIVDLILWFTGKKVSKIRSSLSAKFWPIQPLEDNAFALLELGDITASFHTSWTQWKNEFVFEVYGKTGYLKINGLGGSYGTETLVSAQGAPGVKPTEKVVKFDQPDTSWLEEWKNFKQSVKEPHKLTGSGVEGLEVMQIIERIYSVQ